MQRNLKIVFLIPSSLSKRWLDMFYLDTLTKFFNIEYWNTSFIAYPKFTVHEKQERTYVFEIESYRRLWMELSRLPKDALVVLIDHFNRRNFLYHVIISFFVKNIIIIQTFSFSIFTLSGSQLSSKDLKKNGLFHRVKTVLYMFYPLRAIIKLLKHGHSFSVKNDYDAYVKMKYYQRLEFWENSTRKLFNVFEMSTIPQTQYYFHHPDYEKYLLINGDERIVKKSYVVYIDQYFPYHADLFSNDYISNVDTIAKQFYEEINIMFDTIEKQTGCNVVIAAHPVSDYTRNPFKNRKIFYNMTAELVRDAEYVCLHYSNSLSYVMLYNKPLVMLECETFKFVPSFNARTKQFKSLLHCSAMNCNSQFANFQKVDVNIRNLYLSKTIDTKNATKTNEELYKENFIAIYKEMLKQQKD